jgi:hypothetical protein
LPPLKDYVMQATKAKTTNGTTLKASFCVAKEAFRKMKRQHMEWGKICKHILDKALIFKIERKLIQLNRKKIINSAE